MQTCVGIKGQPRPHCLTVSLHGNWPRPVHKQLGRPRGSTGMSRVLLGLVLSPWGWLYLVPGHRGRERSLAPIWPTFHQVASTQDDSLAVCAVCGSEMCSGCHRPVGPSLSDGPLGTSHLPGGKTGCAHSGAISMPKCQPDACSPKATCGFISCT